MCVLILFIFFLLLFCFPPSFPLLPFLSVVVEITHTHRTHTPTRRLGAGEKNTRGKLKKKRGENAHIREKKKTWLSVLF